MLLYAEEHEASSSSSGCNIELHSKSAFFAWVLPTFLLFRNFASPPLFRKRDPPSLLQKQPLVLLRQQKSRKKKTVSRRHCCCALGWGEKIGRSLSRQRIHVQNKSRLCLLSLFKGNYPANIFDFLYSVVLLSCVGGRRIPPEVFILAHVVRQACFLTFQSRFVFLLTKKALVCL